MKHLILFFSLMILAPTLQAKGPVFPWPLSTDCKALDTADLPGSWVAYAHNSIWFLEFEELDNGNYFVRIDSTAIRHNHALAWFQKTEGHVFVGDVIIDSSHSYKALLFRDYEGTKVRIATSSNHFVDLKLYKRE